jgi:hypothetical protein
VQAFVFAGESEPQFQNRERQAAIINPLTSCFFIYTPITLTHSNHKIVMSVFFGESAI